MADLSTCISIIFTLICSLLLVLFLSVFSSTVWSCFQILVSEKHHAIWLDSVSPLTSEGAESDPQSVEITCFRVKS